MTNENEGKDGKRVEEGKCKWAGSDLYEMTTLFSFQPVNFFRRGN